MSDLLGLVKPLGRYMCLMKHGGGFAQMVQDQIQNQVQDQIQNQVQNKEQNKVQTKGQTKSEPIKP